MSDQQCTLLARVDRLESIHAIQQLPAQYAQMMDARDIDGWLNLFVSDIDCGKYGRGHVPLRKFIESALSSYMRTVHYVCGQTINFNNADNATGKVYCRAEHETNDEWIVMAVCMQIVMFVVMVAGNSSAAKSVIGMQSTRSNGRGSRLTAGSG